MNREQMVEKCCEVMHDAYERAAVGAGWETNPASRKPWANVPEANRATMRAAVSALLGHVMPQVTTVEELEALPNGAVLVSEGGSTFTPLYSLLNDPKRLLPLTVVWTPGGAE